VNLVPAHDEVTVDQFEAVGLIPGALTLHRHAAWDRIVGINDDCTIESVIEDKG
jgi:hypothetical protein